MEIRIKQDVLTDRDYVHFMYNGTPYTISKQYRKLEDKIVLQALKEEPHHFECKEKITITSKKDEVKEESIIESGTIEDIKDEVKEDIKPLKNTKKKIQG